MEGMVFIMTVYLVIRDNCHKCKEEYHVFRSYEKARASVDERINDLVKQEFEAYINTKNYVVMHWPDDGIDYGDGSNIYEFINIIELEVE